jgi:signal transduction histidine kinase
MADTIDRQPEDMESLRAEIARLNKVVQALVNRAERNMSERSDFGLFQTTILLEDRVRERTRELEAALRENEKITRDLQRAKQQMECEIEERKRAHAALEREKEAQRVLIRKLEQAMTQLVQTEKLASLGSLVAGVAHELNTPLGNSLTVASTLNQHVQEFARQLETGDALRRNALLDFVAHCRDAAALVEKNSRRAADLIGNFKQVAVDQTSMRRRSFDLRQALDEVLSMLQPKFKHTRHRLEIAVERCIVLDSFPGPLEQIVTNLVTNSLLHGFEGIEAGVIRIEAAPTSDDRIALSYADNGVGIPEALAKRVFDPFFTTKLGSGGSGLGLYIVFNLVTAVLGGTIALSSSPDQGARFDMLLPRVAAQTATTGEESYAT